MLNAAMFNMMLSRAIVFLGLLSLAKALEIGSIEDTDSPNAGPMAMPAGSRPGTESSKLQSLLGANSGAGDCGCLNWAETFYKRKAYCGRAMELYFLTKNGFNTGYAATEPITGLPHKVCWDFFANFISNACVNVDLLPFPADNETGKQWCYVRQDCQELNGGRFATNAAGFQEAAWSNNAGASFSHWKYCEAGQDDMLKEKTVQEIIDLAESSDVSVSRLLRLAYPAVEIRWAEATYFYERLNAEYAEGLTVAEMLRRMPVPSGWDPSAEAKEGTLRLIASSGQATVLDSPGHSDEFHVAVGRSVYSVIRSEKGDMAYLGGHFFKEFSVTCIMGCAARRQPARDDVDLDTL